LFVIRLVCGKQQFIASLGMFSVTFAVFSQHTNHRSTKVKKALHSTLKMSHESCSLLSWQHAAALYLVNCYVELYALVVV